MGLVTWGMQCITKADDTFVRVGAMLKSLLIQPHTRLDPIDHSAPRRPNHQCHSGSLDGVSVFLVTSIKALAPAYTVAQLLNMYTLLIYIFCVTLQQYPNKCIS